MGSSAADAVPRRQVFRAGDALPARRTRRFCPRCGGACERSVIGGRPRPSCGYCGHVQFENPAPGVALAIRWGARVLLGKRAPATLFGGTWALPAGYVEFDEDFLTAARREAREETGLEVALTGILNVSSNFGDARASALVVTVAAVPAGGTLRPGEEFSALAWFAPPARLPPLAYAGDRFLLAALAQGELPLLPVDRRFAGPRTCRPSAAGADGEE